jgi:hypothetical protein
VTVSDTHAESFEGASTTAGILATEYGATKSNTVSINGGISLNYTVTTPLFYTTDQLSDMEVETSVLQSSFISSDLDTSIPTLNIAEESIASTDIINIETVVTDSDATAASFEYVATTVDILSTSFDSTLEPSHTYQSTNVPVMTSFDTNDMHVDTKSYMSSSGTYPTTPNGNNEQTTSPIQSKFSEKNFIIISASVAGVIIIVVGSLMVLYWLNKLPGQHQHKTNELHRDKPDNITWSSFSPNNYMHNASYSGPVYQYRNIPLRLTSRYNVPYAYDHHMDYQNNWNNI